MYEDACTLIESTVQVDAEEQLAEFGPTVCSLISNLAAFIILRVGRSHIGDRVDRKRGQECYFLVIQMNKKHSVRSDDVAARSTIILAQLWTSKLVIRQPDGTPDSLWLRCRSRLGLSLLYDCHWLWRQEFGGQPNPYEGVEGRAFSPGLIPDRWLNKDTDELNNSTGKMISQVSLEADSLNLMGIGWSPETLFQEFQWPLFDEFAYDDSWQVMGDGQPDLQP